MIPPSYVAIFNNMHISPRHFYSFNFPRMVKYEGAREEFHPCTPPPSLSLPSSEVPLVQLEGL